MRNNDLLDSAFDAPEPVKEAPKVWKRKSSRELDAVFGVNSGDYEEDTIFMPSVVPIAPKAKSKPKQTKVKKKRKKRIGGKKVKPEDAVRLLKIWEKKLLLARRKVQKYRQAVKRYKKQGKI